MLHYRLGMAYVLQWDQQVFVTFVDIFVFFIMVAKLSLSFIDIGKFFWWFQAFHARPYQKESRSGGPATEERKGCERRGGAESQVSSAQES